MNNKIFQCSHWAPSYVRIQYVEAPHQPQAGPFSRGGE